MTQPYGRIEWSAAEIAEHERTPRPRFSGLAHISLPVRDLEEAKRFYIETLGGRLILNLPGFAEVIVAGVVFGLSERRGVPQPPDTEFPHIALSIASDDVLPMKRWLEDHGVATHDVWTRRGEEALMYFKDPSGNLLEMYCAHYGAADRLPKATGMESPVDLRALSYHW